MSRRLRNQIAKEQAEAAAALEPIKEESVVLPPDVPPVTNKKLIIAVFAGITVFLGVYADILDVQFLQSMFRGN
jgi:hypothetical protein